MTEIVLAIVIGAAFGAVLDRIGATNPGYIIKMLNLSDLHLMRTILMGIGVGAVLLFGGALAGLVDVGNMSVKTAHAGVFVGGILLGLGFAVAGYCPGTGLAAAATGRWDAFFFVIGGLAGAAAFMGTYASLVKTSLFEKIAGGKTTLGEITGQTYPALMVGVPGEWIGVGMGIAFILIAMVLPARIKPKRETTVPVA